MLGQVMLGRAAPSSPFFVPQLVLRFMVVVVSPSESCSGCPSGGTARTWALLLEDAKPDRKQSSTQQLEIVSCTSFAGFCGFFIQVNNVLCTLQAATYRTPPNAGESENQQWQETEEGGGLRGCSSYHPPIWSIMPAQTLSLSRFNPIASPLVLPNLFWLSVR